MGLSIPLGQFSFHYPHERAVNIAIDPALGDDANRWSFWQYRPREEYLMAVCAERREGGAPSVMLRKVVPMVEEEVVGAEVLKRSEEAAI
jgi:4'-phosphopantetheinyl transferase